MTFLSEASEVLSIEIHDFFLFDFKCFLEAAKVIGGIQEFKIKVRKDNHSLFTQTTGCTKKNMGDL